MDNINPQVYLKYFTSLLYEHKRLQNYIQNDGTPHPEQQKVADHVISRVTSDNSNFIVTVGDNFYLSVLDSHFDYRVDVLLHQIFHRNELDLDWDTVLGNHDFKGDMLTNRFGAQWKISSLETDTTILLLNYKH